MAVWLLFRSTLTLEADRESVCYTAAGLEQATTLFVLNL